MSSLTFGLDSTVRYFSFQIGRRNVASLNMTTFTRRQKNSPPVLVQDEVDLESTLTAPTSLLAFNTEQWRP